MTLECPYSEDQRALTQAWWDGVRAAQADEGKHGMREALELILMACEEEHHIRTWDSRGDEIRNIARVALEKSK